MTRDEAIKRIEPELDAQKCDYLFDVANGCNKNEDFESWIEALEMAIKSLSEEPRRKGKWEYEDRTIFGYTSTSVICPFCEKLDLFYAGESKEEAKRMHRHLNHNFCHYCGADMRGKE